MRIITWVDLQGRYRVTSPAYADLERHFGFSEDDALNWVWANIVAVTKYGIDFAHPFHVVEDADQRARLIECGGTYFRYVAKPDAKGERSAFGGAWEMDVDGRPKINMGKARVIQMDFIRIQRDKELELLDDLQGQAVGRGDDAERIRLEQEKQTLRDLPQTFNLSTAKTPETLKSRWPEIIPR